jgi:hypothetical protein
MKCQSHCFLQARSCGDPAFSCSIPAGTCAIAALTYVISNQPICKSRGSASSKTITGIRLIRARLSAECGRPLSRDVGAKRLPCRRSVQAYASLNITVVVEKDQIFRSAELFFAVKANRKILFPAKLNFGFGAKSNGPGGSFPRRQTACHPWPIFRSKFSST